MVNLLKRIKKNIPFGKHDIAVKEQSDSLKNNKKDDKKENKERKAKKDWAKIIKERNGWDPEQTKQYLKNMKDNYNIRASEISSMDLNAKSETDVVVTVLLERRKKLRRDECYKIIEEQTGKNRSVVQQEVRYLRSLDSSDRVRFRHYYIYGGYEQDLNDPQKSEIWVHNVGELLADKKYLSEKLEEKGYTSETEIEIEAFRNKADRFLSAGKRQQNFSFISSVRSDIKAGSKEYRDITTDMELTEQLLGFLGDEYAVFHFWEKTFPERMKYVSGRKRRNILKGMNTQEGIDILNNKYKAYCLLKDLYGREIFLLNADSGYEAFESYCREHTTFVKKDNYDSLGRGVEKITLDEGGDLKAVYSRITENGKYIILEDLICPDDCIRKLNPDSVNTIRVTTLRNGDDVFIDDSFLKIGRKGSFVDNGGAGGIFVHVNTDTGTADSDGIIETGEVYKKHPDHGYVFRGLNFPDWEKAMQLVKTASLLVPGMRYIGWDITYQKNSGWIIVEGNANTQFLGQQGTTGKGLLSRILLSSGAFMEGISSLFMLAVVSGMELCGWDIDTAESDVGNSTLLYGITYEEYYLNKFCKVDLAERETFAEQIIRQREIRERSRAEKAATEENREESCLQEVMQETGWSRAFAKGRMDDAQQRTGSVYHDYSRFRFWELSDAEQDLYFTYYKAIELKKRYNSNSVFERLIATNKDLFCESFNKYLKRKWASTIRLDYDTFYSTFKDEERLIYKPRGGSGGAGIRIFDIKREDPENGENTGEIFRCIYDEIRNLPFGVIESFIRQHPDMCRYSGEAVNTLRVVTIRTNDALHGIETGKTHFVYAAMRMGSAEGYTDNLHAGGMVAAVDIQTGIVLTDASDYSGTVYQIHPATGAKIKGFQVPYFKEILELIETVSKELDLDGYLGWDIAVMTDGPEIIELNINPGQGILQIPFVAEKKGMAYVFEDYLH